MANGGSDLVRPSGSDEFDWSSLVLRCARVAASRHHLRGWAEDLAQDVHLWISVARNADEAVNLSWIRRKANSLARNEARRRTKETDAQRRIAAEGGDARDIAADRAADDPRVGIPDLCEGLARLSEPGVKGRALERLILACALAVIDDVVGTTRGSGKRSMIFRAAYDRRAPIGTLADRFKKSREAITEQLRRMCGAVERHLLARLHLATHVREAVAAKTADPGAVRGQVRRALEALAVETGDANPEGET
jgi:hypothetical protein